MASENEKYIISLIDKIVEEYEADAAVFFKQKDRTMTKFSGRFSFKPLAKKFFDNIPENELGDVYVNLFQFVNNYMNKFQKRRVGVKNVPQSFLLIPELLLNMIIPYQLPQQKKDVNSSNEKSEENDGEISEADDISKKKRKSNGRRNKKVNEKPKVTLTDKQSLEIFEHILTIPLNYESKIWKQAKYVLCPNGSSSLYKQFGEIIEKSENNRMISFVALTFFMRDLHIKSYLKNPSTILHALYLGPLNAMTVEMFASNREPQFRIGCREILRVAQHATKDIMSFNLNKPQNIAKKHPNNVEYGDFVKNVKILIKDLKGEYSGETVLHSGWAFAAIKKFGHKRYVENTWKDEQYYDLIWTILSQRPNLKRFVCDVLEKQFQDIEAARFWRRMQPDQLNKVFIQNVYANVENPLKSTDNYINFPQAVKKITVISTLVEMNKFEKELNKRILFNGKVYVGVDAEWSAYSNPSRASILQMSLNDMVFILDLESTAISSNAYRNFLSFLFQNESLIKIGFQFGEDLHQLRAAFRNCVALYSPVNVTCISKILLDTLKEIEKLESPEEFKKEYFPFFIGDIQGEDHNKSMDSKSSESIEEEDNLEKTQNDESISNLKNQLTNKGLSFICEKVLGKPLDKTEQCSVWNRRPLRNSQIRYAAMDAHCMLMLFEKCEKVFKLLNFNISDRIDMSSDIRVSLPLLCEYPL